MKPFLWAALSCLLLAPAALSGPPETDRFAAADANRDGFLSPEEFAAAFPTLKPEAFARIDIDRDGRISREEWRSFSTGHGHQAGGSAPAPQGAFPLLPIPPADPAPDQGDLPLLSPPTP